MIEKEMLKMYANNLMFDMDEKEYEALLSEFDYFLKHISLIDQIDGIKDVSPMTFPYIKDDAVLREDIKEESLPIDDVLANTKNSYLDQIKVPKVVE